MGELRGRRRSGAMRGGRPPVLDEAKSDDNPLGQLHNSVGNGAVGALVASQPEALQKSMSEALDRMLVGLPDAGDEALLNRATDDAEWALEDDRGEEQQAAPPVWTGSAERAAQEKLLTSRGWASTEIYLVMEMLSPLIFRREITLDEVPKLVGRIADRVGVDDASGERERDLSQIDPDVARERRQHRVRKAVAEVLQAKTAMDQLEAVAASMAAKLDAGGPGPQPLRSTGKASAAPTPLSADKPRWQLWPTKEAQRLDLVASGKLKLPKSEAKQLRKDAARIRKDAAGMWDVLCQVFVEHPQWLDEPAMRVETPWTLQLLKDCGGLSPMLLPMVEYGDNAVEAANREINANELAKDRMREVAADNAAGGDRYDADYDDWMLDELEDKLKEAERDQQVKEVLNATKGDNEGMVISESHGDEGSWRFLYEQMPSMRDNEVMTLYLEHFRNSEYQPMLDAYFAAPDAPMPAALAKYIKKFDGNHQLKGKYSLTGVVTRAKEFGLRIVGIDDASAKRASDVVTGDQLESRAARMNVVAEAIVAADQQRFGKHKFVMLMGAKHTHDHETGANTEFPDGIAGVAQLLNLLAVKIGDDDKLSIHRRGQD